MLINLSKKQLNALQKGKNVNLKHADIGVGNFSAENLHPSILSSLHKAYKSGKGIRLNGAGIFGKQFDRAVKKVGLKQPVKIASKIAKPIANLALDEGTKALVSAFPMAGPPAIYAKNAIKNYIDDPSAYQSKSGVKKLLKDSALDSVKDLAKFGLTQYQDYNAGDDVPMSGGKLLKMENFKKRNLKLANQVNSLMPENSIDAQMVGHMRTAVEKERLKQANKFKTLPHSYMTAPHNGKGIKGAGVKGCGIKGTGVKKGCGIIGFSEKYNPYIPTALLSKTTSGGSIHPIDKPRKVYTDNHPFVRPDQVGFDAPSQFIPRPNGKTFMK